MRLRGFPTPGRRMAVPALPRDRPVKLEVGFGKGASLLAAARAEPGTHFVGVEAAVTYYELVAERIEAAGLANVTLLGGDGERLLRELPPGSLEKVSVLFPDPWPKRRHAKRRIITPSFVKAAAGALSPRGAFVLKTDVLDYFRPALRLLDAEPLLVRALVSAKADRVAHLSPMTGFERKFRIAGRRIYGALFVRADRPAGRLPA